MLEQLRQGEGGFLAGLFFCGEAGPASSSAQVEEDVLQPVKGIELREEDRGEMVPNMGI